MESSIIRKLVVAFIAITLLAGSCSTGFVAGRVFQPQAASSLLVVPGLGNNNPMDLNQSGMPEDLEKLFTPFWQAWELVHEQYVEQPVDDVDLMRGAISGMVDALGDENSSYINPDQLDMFNTQLTGEEYEGIGAWVDTTREYLTIISPMVGSPAEKAGLKSGDEILAIDGVDMTGLDGELVRQKVLGPAGTKVVLTIRRPGQDAPIDIEVIRASIKSSNVIGRMLDDNVAYVQLITFGDQKTTKDLRATLQKLLKEKPVGLVLDLRNNGGGLLDSAIDVTSEFISSGVIAHEKYGDGRDQVFKAKRGGLATEIPLVVLVNEGSASASEILAGAVQDLNRGKLVGTATYGKGSVQVWTNLTDDNGAIRVTVARWTTPDGRTIQDTGLMPDVTVEMTDEDIQAGKDPQLDKAVELLLAQ